MLAAWKKRYDKPRQHIKKQRHHFSNKSTYSQNYGFSSSHAQLWVLDHREGWALKNWCFWSVVLEKTLESPLDCKEIKPGNPKGNQSCMFIGRTEAEALATCCEELTHWKRPLCWERLRAGRDGGSRHEMVRQHHWFNGHDFEQTPGDSGGQESLVGCSP